jgi:hypothetical protein
MKPRHRALLKGAVLAVMLCACAASASATRFAFRNELRTNSWRATWSEITFTGGFGTGRCALTLEGSFHTLTITKTRSSLVGFVNAASVSGCTFSGTVLRETLPWHLQYESFSGTLPNISSVQLKIIGFDFRITEPNFGISCLFRSTEALPLIETLTREASGVIRSATLSGTLASGAECGLRVSFGGTTTSFGTPPPPSSTAITLTLI